VKLVVKERGTKAIKRYMKDECTSDFHAISPCFIEALSVLKLKHRRKEIDEETYFAACDILGSYTDGNGDIELVNVNISDSAVFWQVEKIAKRYHLDVIDGCQIFAMTKMLEDLSQPRAMKPVLITSDEDLAKAVRLEGLMSWWLTDTLNVP
jgi:predicted nucleic acid-binding protein